MYAFKTARLTLVRTRENNPTLTSILSLPFRWWVIVTDSLFRPWKFAGVFSGRENYIWQYIIHMHDTGSLKFKYLLLRGRDAKTVSPKSITCVMHEMAWFLDVIRARGRSEIYLHCSTTTFNYFSFSLTNNLVSNVLTSLPATLFVQGAASSQRGKSRTLQKLKWKSSSKKWVALVFKLQRKFNYSFFCAFAVGCQVFENTPLRLQGKLVIRPNWSQLKSVGRLSIHFQL